MSVGVMKDYNLKLRNLRVSHTLRDTFHFLQQNWLVLLGPETNFSELEPRHDIKLFFGY
jgi:hypothetical protein